MPFVESAVAEATRQGTYPLVRIFTASRTRDPRSPTWRGAGLSRSPRNSGVFDPWTRTSGLLVLHCRAEPREKPPFRFAREHHTLHVTSNALLRRAVLALDEPGIGPGIQRYQPRFQ